MGAWSDHWGGGEVFCLFFMGEEQTNRTNRERERQRQITKPELFSGTRTFVQNQGYVMFTPQELGLTRGSSRTLFQSLEHKPQGRYL